MLFTYIYIRQANKQKQKLERELHEDILNTISMDELKFHIMNFVTNFDNF